MKKTGIVVMMGLVVVLSALSVSAMSTDEAIARNIINMYDLDSSQYEIEILNNPLKTAEVLPSEVSLRPMTQKDPLGLFTVKAIVTIDNDRVETAQVRMKIKKYAEVLVVADRIVRNAVFNSDNVAVRRMDVTNLREQPLESVASLAGYRSKRNLRKGTILTRSAIELIPEVEPGNQVDIVYFDGLCRITVPGTVMQKGNAGDYVRVKNSSSNKIIIARVVDKVAVAVDP